LAVFGFCFVFLRLPKDSFFELKTIKRKKRKEKQKHKEKTNKKKNKQFTRLALIR